jgi:phage shock protein E
MKHMVFAALYLVLTWTTITAQAQVPADAVWIDVRTPGEFQQGHLQQAILIPFDGIEAGVAALGLARDTPIYLYCASGGRAGVAKRRLESEGYSSVTNVGGLEDARRLATRATACTDRTPTSGQSAGPDDCS